VSIAKEQIGDYVEDINRRCALGQRWLVWMRVVSAIFWTSWNAFGFIVQHALGKQKAARH
jgi:hypothetical protein